ncbi:hypothetical protein CYY_006007 [Polysphondylium violaceum]|uniref:FAD synthase n=1 Tax=Polysphondylium violaceum TaxID=133409 RepID=A0A8J4UZ91_9MYCE|nr:hypothetical protein CYY_006007 [Polysphondylium violaceum]
MNSNNVVFDISTFINHPTVTLTNSSSSNSCKYNREYTESETKELLDRISHSLCIIEEAFQKFTFKELALSFNGGKDCVVLLHLINYVILKLHKDNNNNIENKTISTDKLNTIYFTSKDSFHQVNEFTEKCSKIYNLQTVNISSGIKEGLQEVVSNNNIKAIFVGTRHTDPNCSHLEKFSYTDPGWPHFLRVNPILEWNYTNIWHFIQLFNVPYCELYDQGFTSIGHINDTIPNPDLRVDNTDQYLPAYCLKDCTSERNGRLRKK